MIGAGVVNALMGAWLVASPFALDYSGEAVWNAVVIGLVVMAVAVIRIRRPMTSTRLSAVTLALGVWLVLATFIVEEATTARIVNNLIIGAVIITEACVSLVFGRRKSSARRERG